MDSCTSAQTAKNKMASALINHSINLYLYQATRAHRS